MRYTAKVVDGYSATAGAQRHTASKLLLVDLLPFRHVDVEQLLLLVLWSRKELHRAHCNCNYCSGDDDEEDIRLPSQYKPFGNYLSLLTTIQTLCISFQTNSSRLNLVLRFHLILAIVVKQW